MAAKRIAPFFIPVMLSNITSVRGIKSPKVLRLIILRAKMITAEIMGIAKIRIKISSGIPLFKIY